MAREDAATTVQIGDGPKIPLDDFVAAADRIAGPSVAANELRLYIERIERLSEEKAGISDDIKDVFAEAKSQGYDPKIMRLCVRLRKMEPHTRQEQVAILETYADAIGLQHVLPL